MQPLLQSKSNKYYIFWVCVCSLRYPACNALAPYCHCGLAWYAIFSTYHINSMIFGKKMLNIKHFSLFNTTVKHKFWVTITGVLFEFNRTTCFGQPFDPIRSIRTNAETWLQGVLYKFNRTTCFGHPFDPIRSIRANAESWLQGVLYKFNRTTCFGQPVDHHQVHES